MNDAVRYLGLNSTKLISVLPNAGLPQNEGGRAVYKLSPAELAQYHKRFVNDYGVSIVGGCCGTTPEHLKAVVDAVSGIEPGEARGRSPRRRFERLHLRPARSRSQAADRRRRNEHHHAGGKLPQPGAREKIRRHSGHGQEAGERRLAHARLVLRHRRRRRKGLHQLHPGKGRHPRAGADPRRFDRSRCGRRSAEAHSRARPSSIPSTWRMARSVLRKSCPWPGATARR